MKNTKILKLILTSILVVSLMVILTACPGPPPDDSSSSGSGGGYTPPAKTQLDAPVISSSGARIVWQAVPDATVYYIFVDGVQIDSTSSLSYKISGSKFFDKEIKIKAGGSTTLSDSEFSNSLVGNVA